MVRTALPVALVLLASGCARERPEAPAEMVDLVEYMFVNWEDDEKMRSAVDNIQGWMEDNVETDEADEGWSLEPLSSADMDVVDHPNGDPANQLGAAGAGISKYGLTAHTSHMIKTDQVFSNPGSYKKYDRVVEGNVSTFTAGSGSIRTINQVETASFGVTVPYELLKDYKWVQGEEGRAIVARSWVEEQSCNDGGGNCLEQSFSIDLFQKNGSKTMRLTATWSEVSTSIKVGDDLLVASLAKGLQDVFDKTEEHLDGD